MTETANEFCLVELASRLFHPAHGGHLGVHRHELVFSDLDVERGRVAVVRPKRVLVQFDHEWVRRGRILVERRRVRRSLDRAR